MNQEKLATIKRTNWRKLYGDLAEELSNTSKELEAAKIRLERTDEDLRVAKISIKSKENTCTLQSEMIDSLKERIGILEAQLLVETDKNTILQSKQQGIVEKSMSLEGTIAALRETIDTLRSLVEKGMTK